MEKMSKRNLGPSASDSIFEKIFLTLLSYRLPMPVTQLKVFTACQGRPAYYVCPRCGCTMEREFMAFCDRCGQRLDWRGYRRVEIIYR